jgi:hypothetical protein
MIMMQHPSLVINSHDVPWPTYKMWRTINAPVGITAAVAVQHIVDANRMALAATGKSLQNIVINCHGANEGGALYIGGEENDRRRGGGIRLSTVIAFSVLKPLNVGTIWLVACQAAIAPLGKQLCQGLATTAGAQVVAADEDQEVGIWGGWRILTSVRDGIIDEFEGTVYSFTVRRAPTMIDPHEAIFTIME